MAMEWKSACAEILVGNDSMISLVLCNSTMYGRAVSTRKMIYRSFILLKLDFMLNLQEVDAALAL